MVPHPLDVYSVCAADRDAVLRRCEGFMVACPQGQLGFVEEIALEPATDRPVSLLVRAGRIIVVEISVDEIESVHAPDELILVRSHLDRLAPEIRGGRMVLTPSLAALQKGPKEAEP